MCWNCCDCAVLSNPGEPATLLCVGFKEKQLIVAINGMLTNNYRWCSDWTQEQIDAFEEKLLKKQKELIK